MSSFPNSALKGSLASPGIRIDKANKAAGFGRSGLYFQVAGYISRGMTTTTSHDITQLLDQVRNGEAGALDRLLPLVYEQLRLLAHRQRVRPGAADTLNTTALVHEAYEKLAGRGGGWNDREHFFRVAAKAMRSIQVDYARNQLAAKRAGGTYALPLDESGLMAVEQPGELLALDEALSRLTALDARQGEVVELRYFIGLTIPETADVLGISSATVKREWTSARAWLHREISDP